MDLAGSATVLRLPLLASKLEEVPSRADLHISFDRLSYIDHACLDLIFSWGKQANTLGGSLAIDRAALEARFRQSTPRLIEAEPGETAAA